MPEPRTYPSGEGLYGPSLCADNGTRELVLVGMAKGGSADCVLNLLEATLSKLGLRERVFRYAFIFGGGRLLGPARCDPSLLLAIEGAGAASNESAVPGLETALPFDTPRKRSRLEKFVGPLCRAGIEPAMSTASPSSCSL